MIIKLLLILLFIFGTNAILYPQSTLPSEKTKIFLNQFLLQSTDEPAQQLKQQLASILNKVKAKVQVDKSLLIDTLISTSAQGDILKCIFDYDNNVRMTWMIGFLKINDEWYSVWKKEYFYDVTGNFERIIDFYFNNSVWDTSSQLLYEYNGENQLTILTLQDYLNSNWQNNTREETTYDINGNEHTSLTKFWENNQWENGHLITFYYSSENLKDSLLMQNWDGQNWVDNLKSILTYNDTTQYFEQGIAKIWTGSKWENYEMIKVTNDEYGNQIEQTFFTWNGNNWLNAVRKHFTYYDKYLESGYCELWNGLNWEAGDNVILINNPDGFNLGLITQRVFIYYIIVSVDPTQLNIPTGFSLSQNYPNPFNPITKIKYSILTSSFVQLKVYDVLGNEIATLFNEEKQSGTYEVEFNGNELPSGVYFYQLKADNYSETKKMLLMK